MRWLLNLFKRSGPSWVDLGPLRDFPPNTSHSVIARGVPLAVFHDGETGISVIGDVCPHMGAQLSAGTLHPDGSVECPAHKMRFNLKTGKCSIGPVYSARVFRYRTQEGRLQAYL